MSKTLLTRVAKLEERFVSPQTALAQIQEAAWARMSEESRERFRDLARKIEHDPEWAEERELARIIQAGKKPKWRDGRWVPT